METSDTIPEFGLAHAGLHHLGLVYFNLTTAGLYEQAIRRYEGRLAHLGPLVVTTGVRTGRSAKDRFVVEADETDKDVWWGKINVRFPRERFDHLHKRMAHYLRARAVFVQDVYAGADERFRQRVRVISTHAWPALFARNMFIRPPSDALKDFVPDYTVIHCPDFATDPDVDGTRSGTFIGLDLRRKLMLIGGSHYGGEIKKSVFSALNFLYPSMDVLPMHCSANQSTSNPDDVAIFFGLSGTGKTTLSSDPDRILIGDDEHGWSDRGVFNFEGGCYAKVIRLSAQAEPDIFQCTRRFGTILENVVLNHATHRVDLDDETFTENTRASYPITHIPNASVDGAAGHPRNVIMLTCDAFGVLPPIAKLSPEQAMYHFISGYTAMVAGTEMGVTEPKEVFSPCFGAPFMVRHPSVYAEMLAQRLKTHKADCWLVNTGWSGGPYGEGHRMKIGITRALISAALDGSLAKAEFQPDPRFGIMAPKEVHDVPSEVLWPRNTWADKDAYDAKAKHLAGLFAKNFEQYKDQAGPQVAAANPKTD